MRLFIIGITLVLILVLIKICLLNKEKINFFTKGIDEKFRFTEIHLLWKLAKECEIENPLSLYVSVPTLNKCISMIITKSRKTKTEKSFKTQDFLARLYKYRTKIALDTEGKKGLEDTRSLMKDQRLRIIMKGKGVFLSKILNSGRELIITVPRQNNMIKIPGEDWVSKTISVYLWRKGDASYVFDSLVYNTGMFNGEPCIYLKHTDKLLRAQKRQSIRCQCKIFAQMYVITSDIVDFNIIENEPGYKCLLEDISEDGAMIRIGGKGKIDAQIKLQFTLSDSFIIMYGVIRAVEFNEKINQSRVHFECTHVDPAMRNSILSYVYNVIPEEDKEINEAIAQTESDALEAGENDINNSNPLNMINDNDSIISSESDSNSNSYTLNKNILEPLDDENEEDLADIAIPDIDESASNDNIDLDRLK